MNEKAEPAHRCFIKWLVSLITGFVISAGEALEINASPVNPGPNLATQIAIIADLSDL